MWEQLHPVAVSLQPFPSPNLLCAPTVVHSQTPRELPTCGYMGFCTYMVCIPGVCMYPMEFPIGAP